jgi:signal transduction histidine kinase
MAGTEPTRSPALLSVCLRVAGCVAMVAGVTGVMVVANKVADARLLEIVFILPVLTAAVLWGLVYALGVSITSAVVFEVYFLPPQTQHQFSFSLSNIVGLAVFIVCASVVSELANRAHARARVSEQARDRIAEEQSALRRVATLVAREVSTSTVFDAVAAEMGQLIDATSAYVSRFESDGGTTIVSSWREGSKGLPVGSRFAFDKHTVSGRVYTSGRPERIDFTTDSESSGQLSAALQRLGITSCAGAPITVGGRIWGAVVVATEAQPTFSEASIARLADFTELVSTAISNSTARSELEASRSRIVAAGDAERRRIERDIHDGAQQRLVALALELRGAELSLPPEQDDARKQLDAVARELGNVLDELRELSRGIHPSLLTDRGLKAALRSLARRSPIPVELQASSDDRFPEALEVAAYYVASEALVNAAKHACASVVTIELEADGEQLLLSVSDDGVGGADPSRGSGLVGLADRVGALGGRCTLSSPVGGGTTLAVELPLERRLSEVTEQAVG